MLVMPMRAARRHMILVATLALPAVWLGATAVRAAGGVFYADDSQGWHNAADPTSGQLAIEPGESVRWENRDPAAPHSVGCVAEQSNNVCPWSDAKDLPPAETNGSEVTPTVVTIEFPEPGSYWFRCRFNPDTMVGLVVVGEGFPRRSPTPSPSPSPMPSPLPIRDSTNPPVDVNPAVFADPPRSPSPAAAARAAGREPDGAERAPPVALMVGGSLLVILVGAAHIRRIVGWLRR